MYERRSKKAKEYQIRANEKNHPDIGKLNAQVALLSKALDTLVINKKTNKSKNSTKKSQWEHVLFLSQESTKSKKEWQQHNECFGNFKLQSQGTTKERSFKLTREKRRRSTKHKWGPNKKKRKAKWRRMKRTQLCEVGTPLNSSKHHLLDRMDNM